MPERRTIRANRDATPEGLPKRLEHAKMEAYFLSDIHLKQMEHPDARVLLDFLGSLGPGGRGATHLFLVGDIFDFWLGGNRHFRWKFSPIVEHLRALASHGVEVHYFEGNHDFNLRDFWQGELDIRVHTQAGLFVLGDLTVRVEHGDLLDPTDRGYRFLRWLLRTPLIGYAGTRLPGSLLDRICRLASLTSRRYTSRRKTISDGRARKNLRGYAQKAMEEDSFDLIITGHMHVRDDYAFEYRGRRARSVNLGCWEESRSTFRITSARQEFVELPSEGEDPGGSALRSD